MPDVRIVNVTKKYGKIYALDNVSLTIHDKEYFSLLGPSGCGKTTLLKTFNRLHDASLDVRVEGKLLLDGEDIYDPKTEVTHIRKKMGLLSQRPFPLPMSIFDNVAYGPKIHGERDKAKLEHTVESYLKDVALWNEVKDKLHTPASKLSIGQQQRLCLARGLAVGPEIILGDEPTSALDPKSTQAIEELFLVLKEKYTIVLVTHILRQARRVSDNIVFINNGEIIEMGLSEQILLNPQQQLTKEYVRGYVS